MNIQTIVFITCAGDTNTSLVNNPKLSDYKPYLLEVGTYLSDINKKAHRKFKNEYDDIICDIADATHEYILQAHNLLKREFITKIQYDKIDDAIRLIHVGVMIECANAIYVKSKEKGYNTYFEKLLKSYDKLSKKFECMLNDSNDVLHINVADCIYEPMVKNIHRMIDEYELKQKKL